MLMKDDHEPMTGEARAERRRNLAAFVLEGATLAEAAQKYNVSFDMVRRSCVEHGVAYETPGQTKRRIDAQIIEALQNGGDIIDIANETGRSIPYVRDLKRRKIKRPVIDARPTASGSTYLMLARLINTNASLREIADEFQVSHQRIAQIRNHARKAGIALHPARR